MASAMTGEERPAGPGLLDEVRGGWQRLRRSGPEATVQRVRLGARLRQVQRSAAYQAEGYRDFPEWARDQLGVGYRSLGQWLRVGGLAEADVAGSDLSLEKLVVISLAPEWLRPLLCREAGDEVPLERLRRVCQAAPRCLRRLGSEEAAVAHLSEVLRGTGRLPPRRSQEGTPPPRPSAAQVRRKAAQLTRLLDEFTELLRGGGLAGTGTEPLRQTLAPVVQRAQRLQHLAAGAGMDLLDRGNDSDFGEMASDEGPAAAASGVGERQTQQVRGAAAPVAAARKAEAEAGAAEAGAGTTEAQAAAASTEAAAEGTDAAAPPTQPAPAEDPAIPRVSYGEIAAALQAGLDDAQRLELGIAMFGLVANDNRPWERCSRDVLRRCVRAAEPTCDLPAGALSYWLQVVTDEDIGVRWAVLFGTWLCADLPELAQQLDSLRAADLPPEWARQVAAESDRRPRFPWQRLPPGPERDAAVQAAWAELRRGKQEWLKSQRW